MTAILYFFALYCFFFIFDKNFTKKQLIITFKYKIFDKPELSLVLIYLSVRKIFRSEELI